MKCPYCGGEVPSQSLSCPYCGRENPEGIAFHKEVQERIERNKLLKPFLIKQKTPELVQKMLSRIWLILVGVNVCLFLFTFIVYLVAETEGGRTPENGSYAEMYMTQYGELDNWYYESFVEQMQAFISDVENHAEVSKYAPEWLVDYSYGAMREFAKEDYPGEEEGILTIYAFFQGYLGFTDEEMDFLHPNEDGEYDWYLEDEVVNEMVNLINEKLEVPKQ